MSATSSDYWRLVERIKDDLNEISSLGIDMYGQLESNDDPEEVANLLVNLQGKIFTVSEIIAKTIPAMQDIAEAYDTAAAIKS